jgi:hypothetical protein
MPSRAYDCDDHRSLISFILYEAPSAMRLIAYPEPLEVSTSPSTLSDMYISK